MGLYYSRSFSPNFLLKTVEKVPLLAGRCNLAPRALHPSRGGWILHTAVLHMAVLTSPVPSPLPLEGAPGCFHLGEAEGHTSTLSLYLWFPSPHLPFLMLTFLSTSFAPLSPTLKHKSPLPTCLHGHLLPSLSEMHLLASRAGHLLPRLTSFLASLSAQLHCLSHLGWGQLAVGTA